MEIMDVVFGKRLTNSFYHINTSYLKRYELNEEEKVKQVVRIMVDTITELASKRTYDDEVMVTFNKLLTNLKELDTTIVTAPTNAELVSKINESFAVLSYLEYELWFVVRKDLEEATEIVESDRSYVLNKVLTGNTYLGLSNVLYGLLTLLPDNSANMNSMIMEFIDNDLLLPVKDQENQGLIGIDGVEYEYSMLRSRNESVLMDTSKLLKMLEKSGYVFFLSLNPILVE